ncbi:MAG: hypothetical protein Q8Q09_06955 [Deltaproteobacteria bacterium]|nr:hypothetical protein [Deltaproteobacteria bacterium]
MARATLSPPSRAIELTLDSKARSSPEQRQSAQFQMTRSMDVVASDDPHAIDVRALR